MAADDGEHELTDDDRRILKYVADQARDQMPTRREALKLGVTGFAAAGLGSAATGAALGADTSVGNVGTTGSPVDTYIDEIRDHGGDVVVDIDDTGTLDWNRGANFPAVNTPDATISNSINLPEKIIGPNGGIYDLNESGLRSALSEAASNGGGVVTVGSAARGDIIQISNGSLPTTSGLTIKGPSIERVPSIRRMGDFTLFDFAADSSSGCHLENVCLETDSSVTATTNLVKIQGLVDNYGNSFRRVKFDGEGAGSGTAPCIQWSGSHCRMIDCWVTSSPVEGLFHSGRYNTIAHTYFGDSLTPAIYINSGDTDGGNLLFQNQYEVTGSTSVDIQRQQYGMIISARGNGNINLQANSGIVGNYIRTTPATTVTNPSNGVRNIINGWGYNSGDPNTTGDWTGNGIEGVTVRDTTNNNNYVYINGAWQTV